ncbi:unnamed protein product [Linum tenue]|uniref:Cytochrome P450 n=1 Tax=Linum tenue TaxID=586396 RepID=A0AAV0L4S6_9ROSI|nr:unnamed protein product [Linum tenue]
MVAEIGWDPEVWEDPIAFEPERFLEIGIKEIRMIPFGGGRRMCPGYTLDMLHLEYFMANLVWNFKWETAWEVDLWKKPEFQGQS